MFLPHLNQPFVLQFDFIFSGLMMLKMLLVVEYLWALIPVLILVTYVVFRWISFLKRRVRDEEILNYFATSLYGHNTVTDIFWDISRNCISKLHFLDCVIYQYDPERNMLVQKAAYGPKNPIRNEILNPIEIPYGKGIVGYVAKSRKGEIVNNTARDHRYILDDQQRYSEITVPIMVDGALFGIIDSEHPKKNFYRKSDLTLLGKISEICGAKISKYLVEEKLRAAIARDLHDELGSTLTSIHIISQLALQYSNGNEQVAAQLVKIRDHVGKMMESMSDIVWVINPYNDTLDKMVIRMKEFAAEIFDPAQIHYEFSTDEHLDEVKLNPEQRKDFYLIFKEALNNIVKYSKAKSAFIEVHQQNNCLVLHIRDEGVGFDPEKIRGGNGLRNMQERARNLGGRLCIDTAPAKGVSIKLFVAYSVSENDTDQKLVNT